MSDSSSSDIATDAESVALLAPVLAGCAAHFLLVGILLSSLTHHLTSPGPSWSSTSPRLKRLILFVAFLTTFIAALQVNDLLHFGTLQQRDAGSLLRGTRVETLEPVLVGLVGSLVQSVLVYRASRIMRKECHRWLLLCSAGLLIVVSFLGSLGTSIWSMLYYLNPFLESPFKPTFNNCVVIWLLCGAFVDTLITITYVVQLHSRLAGFNPTTDSALKMIINTSLQSAAYTTVIAIPGAILSLAYNGEDLMTCDIAYAFFLPLPACYALSLFTTLSVPDKLQSHHTSGVVGSFPRSTRISYIGAKRGESAEHQVGVGARYESWEDRRPSMSSIAFDPSLRSKPSSRPSSTSFKLPHRSLSLPSLPSLPRAPPGIQVHVQLHVEEDRIEDDEFEALEKGREKRLLGTRVPSATYSEVQPGLAGPGVRVQKGVVASGGSRGIRR